MPKKSANSSVLAPADGAAEDEQNDAAVDAAEQYEDAEEGAAAEGSVEPPDEGEDGWQDGSSGDQPAVSAEAPPQTYDADEMPVPRPKREVRLPPRYRD